MSVTRTDGLTMTDILDVPHIESVTYQNNFITNAVCELRFPTLLGFDETALINVRKKLKRDYPLFEMGQSISVGGPDGLNKETHYYFYSKDRKWWVKFRSSAVTLETEDYKDFEDFSKRLEAVISASKDSIDTDFFTRVGLRYINLVPIKDNELSGWIRPELISSILTGALGTLRAIKSEVQGFIADGFYSFRHGLRINEKETGDKSSYFLDFDYFDENVEVGNAVDLVKKYNEVNFSFFQWCLAEKAVKELGPGKKKQ